MENKHSDADLLERLGMKRELKKRQMNYVGHIKRYDAFMKAMLEGKIEMKGTRCLQWYFF